MAMNEDSVVASLNELRRMANDRARRETEARGRVDDRGGWDQQRGPGGRRRTTEIKGEVGGHNPTLLGGHDAGPAPQAGYGGYGYGGYGYGQGAQAALPDIPVEPPRQRSAAGPVLLTILLLGGAAGGGYWKLQQDWQATLKARDAALLAAEEARNKAVEVAAKAEQLARVQIATCTKAGAPAATTPTPAATTPATAAAAAAVVPPAATKPVAAKQTKAEKKTARRAAARQRSMARALPPPPVEEEKKAAPMPKIANKKKLTDDPLAGLKM
jgi:hypothetical protein